MRPALEAQAPSEAGLPSDTAPTHPAPAERGLGRPLPGTQAGPARPAGFVPRRPPSAGPLPAGHRLLTSGVGRRAAEQHHALAFAHGHGTSQAAFKVLEI